ncbi:MAG: permease-like cell division protein FtsX [Solitalea sp.]
MMQEPVESRPGNRKKKGLSVSTVISISLVLLMVGVLGMIILAGKNLSNYVKENIYLSVIFQKTAAERQVLQLQEEIAKLPGVRETEYISKEKAAESLQQELGEDFMTFLGYNPLPASMDVHVQADYASSDSIAKLEKQLRTEKLVEDVIYQKSLVDSVNSNIRTISLVLLGVCALLAVIAIALINNTIRLAIYSQRFIIKSMQLVGATKNFIKRPFLWLGVLHGLIGALVAIGLLVGLVYFAERQLPELKAVMNYQELGTVFIMMFICGIVISLISTYFAVSKYLRKRMPQLYH